MGNFMIALDCTFRDGGYYPNWQFEISLANKYLSIMKEVGINAIEIGFRSPLEKQTGIFAKVTDDFIVENLSVPEIEYFGVMVNTSDMNSKVIKQLFTYVDKSPINLVRAATHFKDVELGELVCKDLKNLGYFVTCNLMQAADKSFYEIRSAAKKISEWNSVDVLYLADSLGGMDHDTVNYAFKAIREGWNGTTGFHGHNNKGQALSNSLEAIDIGVEWIDGTILGMGRGPGNTEIEYLLNELNKRNFEFEVEKLYELSLVDFLPLKLHYRWGPSLLYYLTAEYNIHPIYVQKFITEGCSMKKILKAIFYLRDIDSRFFNKEIFNRLLK
jgi:4-hydroxy 2-oxovalerate aldolase